LVEIDRSLVDFIVCLCLSEVDMFGYSSHTIALSAVAVAEKYNKRISIMAPEVVTCSEVIVKKLQRFTFFRG
jgi:hypothetical protein